MKKFFKAALENVVRYGDTDIFPFPIENYILGDKKSEMIDLLFDAYSHFDQRFPERPPVHINALVPVGPTGFRSATQQDPFWNAFLLGLTLSVSSAIEKHRIPVDKKTVFSYRISDDPSDGGIFQPDINWRGFIERSTTLAKKHPYVVVCDISDCYQRIPHHRLENALKMAGSDTTACRQIMRILNNFSNGKSYSVPVGGPAARILVEALLNLSDQLLRTNGITFVRYADDYHIFVESLDEAYRAILFLSDKLSRNEGLALQKAKTRIMKSSEFLSTQALIVRPNDEDISPDVRHLFSLNLRYDPYSDTAEDDYALLKGELNKIDIIGILNRELAKTRVHGAVTKKAIQAIRHLEENKRGQALITLARNIDSLYPIFPVVAITIKACLQDLASEIQDEIFESIRKRIHLNSFVFSTDLHASFAVRVLCERKTPENVDSVADLHRKFSSPLVRRDVLIAMARWGEFAWLSDQMNDFQGMSAWEKRAFIVASYALKDAGRAWRDRMKQHFSPFEKVVRDWAAGRMSQPNWVPSL